ncbi:MAG: ribonuclease D [Pseudomonadota bacterium]
MIIQSTQELSDICAKLAKKPYITIDTEFLRDKTYFSKLCLVQLAAEDVDPVAIDPVGTDVDLAPLFQLLQNKKVVKVFHAARQDLEIFYQLTDKVPTPIFDTQVAAMVCGYGDSISYAKLVGDITDTQLAKTSQFTDWSKRPLSKKQLSYALGDVTHLRDVYEYLSERLHKQKRLKWVEEEMAILTNPKTYEIAPQEVWQRIKIRSDKPRTLAILRELAAWRENLAVKKDLPRNRIVKDDVLAGIALYEPKTKEALQRIRGIPAPIAKGRDTKTILDLIQKALKSPEKSWPKIEAGKPFPKELSPSLEMMKLLLKINASENDVVPKLIASPKDLEKIVLNDKADVIALKGWRHELFGKEALLLKKGKIALTIEKNKIKKISI